MKALVWLASVAMLASTLSAQQVCLQSPPGLPGGNGQNGAMFDVGTTGGATVIIQEFKQAFSAAGQNATVEVYAVTGGGSFVGKETTPAAWTLLATAPNITTLGPGMAQPLGLSLNFLIPGNAVQGFYVTCSNGPSIDYTNGTGTPGVSPVASDLFITVFEGVGKAYPFGTTFTPRNWNGEVCYIPGMGLFAGFSAMPTSGNAPLNVQFFDQSFSSAPGGVTSWLWDFGDGTTSPLQNPSHTYQCPGIYNVTLTVNDGMFPPSTLMQPAFINVGNPQFSMSTMGMGDLTIVPVGSMCFPTAVRGFTLPSLTATPGVFGNGPFLGITPDFVTITFITLPPVPGSVPHFLVVPGGYPDTGPFTFPPGTFSALTGVTMDALEVLLNAAGSPLLISNVAQVTF